MATLQRLADLCASFGECSFPERCDPTCRLRMEANTNCDAACLRDLLGARDALGLGPVPYEEIAVRIGADKRTVFRLEETAMSKVKHRLRVEPDSGWSRHIGYGAES